MQGILRAREQPDVHHNQLVVIFARSPLRQHATDGVAVVAGVLQRIRRDLVALIPE